ncbi:NUDIX hydrolase [Planotetraspora thailandica]|uniref:NUDIX hydrolase n=1 Tax=Planotetraspora thailandica TaxID=487172 RepID=A0A8J3Y2U0_9ACTN|nr:NUDIX hydrolase [Planotetraspora thailandica]GII59711.1 NUDIX hydrolase [Planotetraspora thailandica]
MTGEDKRHSVSVAGVVVDDHGRVLLTQRADNGQWEAPGGVLELGEGIAEGVRRELLEETGLTVEPVALTGVYKNMARGVIALVFRCKATGGQLSLNDEVQRFHWATLAEVREMATEAFAVRVLDALQDGAPAVRQHDGVHLV